MSFMRGFRPDFQENLQKELDRIVANKVCAGASIMVGRFGELACACHSGWADLEQKLPIQEDTLFQMRSLTKAVTAVAVMQLWEKGVFQLDDPVAKYIPEYEPIRVCHVLEDGTEVLRPAENTMTIWNLLTMTSGIPYVGTGLVEKAVRKLSDELIESRRSGCPWSTIEYARRLTEVPLVFEPSNGFLYGLGFDVLGALVEIWTGSRMDEYCRRNIFEPLGIQSATFLQDITDKKLAVPYTLREDGTLQKEYRSTTYSIDAHNLLNRNYISGGGGLICTLPDYFKFAKMLANRGRTDAGVCLIKESTIDLIATPALTPVQRKDYAREGDTCLFAECYSYGYGVHVCAEDTGLLPKGEWGWAGSLGSWLSIDPMNEVFWVYAHQITPYRYEEYVPNLSRLIYESLT